MSPLLEVKNLFVKFPLAEREVNAVRGVSFTIEDGKTLGLVGESGCGKSVTAFSILNLLSSPGIISSGEIFYKGQNLINLSDEGIRKIRGSEIAMIFQEPSSSLNPVYTIGSQIMESLIHTAKYKKKEALEYTYELLNKVGISPNKFNSYPHELSGGLKQRVMIAIALSLSPSLLIADEPTTALDVTIQAQILDLLLKLQEENGMSLLFITHDLGVVSNMADNIAIMYAGEIVESGVSTDLFNSPKHPYTKGLFDAIPKFGSSDRLKPIPGNVPIITDDPVGCVFYERCNESDNSCLKGKIKLRSYKDNHYVRCLKSIK